MKNTSRLDGAYAPILTPFTSDRSTIDWESYRRHLSFLEKEGLNGILVLGTNGEFGRLTIEERIQLVEATIATGTTLKLIIGGVVPDSPEETMTFVARLADYADQLAAVLVAPPFFDEVAAGRTIPEDSVVDFYRKLANVQDRIPLMLYNVPVPAGGPVTAAIPPRVVAALSDEAVIMGIKDSTACLENIPAYREAKLGLQVLVGNDHVMAEGFAHGAAGSITACGNVFPSAVLTVHQSASGPDRETAQAELSDLRRILELIPGKMVATQKLLLHHFGTVSTRSPVRDRDQELTIAEQDQVLARLEQTVAGLAINQMIQLAIRR
ncbi:MAG: dihydrodipicolinate synthase family protein [Candidatus Neomarinimicrobiota bacterium]